MSLNGLAKALGEEWVRWARDETCIGLPGSLYLIRKTNPDSDYYVWKSERGVPTAKHDPGTWILVSQFGTLLEAKACVRSLEGGDNEEGH